MIIRKEALKSLFKQYFEVIPAGADVSPSIIRENAKRQVESLQKMRQLAKENSLADVPKKANASNGEHAPPSLTTERVPSPSSSSSSSSSLESHSQEIELKLFLYEMERGRKKCELIFGHKKGTDPLQAKRLGVEASQTMPGCYKRNLDSTITRGPEGWSEFVISYDNKFILNYTSREIEKVTAKGTHQFEFNHQTMDCGTFLKAAGKIRILDNGKIVISPYSEYLELGWDYIPIILFVLREKGLSVSNENIFIANEQGDVILHPETSQSNKIPKSEQIVPFYLNESRFPLAKAIAENKELDVKGILSKLFLSIDDSILGTRNKKDISELITKKDQLKTAIVNLLLALIRNDLPNDLFKIAGPTIDAQLSEINKNSELIKNKFGFSIKAVVDETVYKNLCKINENLELMKNRDGDSLKNILSKITRNKFLKLNKNINSQAEKNNSDVESEATLEKSIHEKLFEIKRNIESISRAQAKKDYKVVALKEAVDKVIYENLCEINESILSIKNKDGVTLKEFTGKTARQNYGEVNEAIQLIKDSHGIDLSFVGNELDNWLHYIFNLKFQHANKLGIVARKGESVLSAALHHVEINLKEIKVGSLPQRHTNEVDLINSPFVRFCSENPTKTCIALLRDYTKGGFFWRLLTGAWRRHHIKAVEQLLKGYDNQQYSDNLSVQDIYRELFNLNEGTLAEYTGKKGTLYARLLWCETLENGSAVDPAVPVVSVVNEGPSQSEVLSNRGEVPLNSRVEEMPAMVSTSVASPVFYRGAKRDSQPPLTVPTIVIEGAATPPMATSSPGLGC
ncbi:DUF5617 domain-containing protein [Rickettsiella endosymbiont of Dermanyssus gallinae]|uniref:DUF5617 domain-containing protein n=1 Tax=Rickettsiella endosymbiont of Dermanyssus gallinae TaxID=2856608 RepID=UPI001C52F780|nr:DUF5617 domain-containing protein [Rickettsiella endosymbiont of Dermanyssus gallinae]